jgi:RNA polymerase sigma-70 factor (ECF subfamily)
VADIDAGTSELGAEPQFVHLLTDAQVKLYAFICSLLGGSREARDVLQETNMALWRKSAEYDPSLNFLTWAYTFARYQVMAHREKASRERMIFDERLLDDVAECVAERNTNLDERLRILDECIAKLSPVHREILIKRYQKGMSFDRLSAELGHRVGAVRVLLHRIRLALGRCIQQLAGLEGST